MTGISKEIKECAPLVKASNKLDTEYKVSQPNFLDSTPQFPDDVTSLSSEDVVRYLASYDSECARIRYLVAQTDYRIKYGKYIISTAKKKVFVSMRAQGDKSVPDTNAEVDISAEFLNADHEVLELEAEKVLLDARLDIFQKYSTLMSRELSRRRGETNSDFNSAREPSSAQQSRVDKLKGKELVPLIHKKKK